MFKLDFWLGLLLCFGSSQALHIDSLVAKANIYCQLSVPYTETRELVLSNIENRDSRDELKLIIHGYLGSRQHGSIKPLKNAYLAKGTTSVLLADWEDAANLDYRTSRHAVAKVALHFGKLLEDHIGKHNISLNRVHVIGHSLGAHIAGGVGRYFNGSLGRVTGLDPALPLFTVRSADGLHVNDAQFVDVIHTDYPIFGDLTPRGNADFYPNFGHTPQRGCDDNELLAASKLILEAYSCSHNRAVLFYAESIGLPRQFPSIPCSLKGIKARQLGICTKSLNATALAGAILAVDETQLVYMGEEVSRSAKGIYYLATNEAPPFGMGVYTKF